MNHTLPASSPRVSATVIASAGTGKTWLLVTRIVHLLLDGNAPDAILAITFTRKAAAEMQARLAQRLFDLSRAEGQALAHALEEMGITPAFDTLQRAPQLYERWLRGMRRVRATTFHAFCQDVLRRFPLEADVPAGFEVLESASLLEKEAWEALVAEATAAPGGPLARALDALLDASGSLATTRQTLAAFLARRGDWWAYTFEEADSVSYASAQLAAQLDVDEARDPAAEFFNPFTCNALSKFAALLALHDTKTNLENADRIARALASDESPAARLDMLRGAFLTQKNQPRARNPSKKQRETMGGDAAEQHFIELHARLSQQLLETFDHQNRRRTLEISRAWFTAGTRLLAHYQRIKTEQRALDFTDLEWKAHTLLNHADNALWVQYKLDQRIDHLLVDEFQDTNPTQWRLLLPLLQEMAAGGAEHTGTQRARSVFLVGDMKQSIYRFRRADPRLFDAARAYLSAELDAGEYTLDKSRRSASAVIQFVNQVFGAGPLHEHLPHFHPHETYREELWGRVELLPLIQNETTDETPPPENGALRNPLLEPRHIARDTRHHREGQSIARRIRSLLEEGAVTGPPGAARVIDHGDILILVRNRTHLHAYEQALREANIPYVGADRGTLLDCLEIQDMVQLLRTLIAPYDNLALAQVLRSPLFACGDDDLMTLAAHNTQASMPWWQRLAELGPRLPPDSALRRAQETLARWREWTERRPVHDALDRIYCDGDVIRRFEAAFPAHLRARVRANLERFIELALEVDSGRYPSLLYFLNRLREIHALGSEAPDEAVSARDGGGVRLLTIHAAKGLEAPAVFIADATATRDPQRAFQALVQWPAHAARPERFLLTGASDTLDSLSAQWLDEEDHEARREDANLLYVALTRARQFLFISGCAPKPKRNAAAKSENEQDKNIVLEGMQDGKLGWYGLIAARLGDDPALCETGWSLTTGTAPPAARGDVSAETVITPDPRLALPLPSETPDIMIAPSRAGTGLRSNHQQSFTPLPGGEGEYVKSELIDEDGRPRGIVLHRMLEELSGEQQSAHDAVWRRIQHTFGDMHAPAELQAWWQEAIAVLRTPSLRDFFDPAHYTRAWNEVPIHYETDGAEIYGFIDRLVMKDDELFVLDYKTHRAATPRNAAALAETYREQMRLYCEGVRRLWPDKRVRGALLFTACGHARELTA